MKMYSQVQILPITPCANLNHSICLVASFVKFFHQQVLSNPEYEKNSHSKDKLLFKFQEFLGLKRGSEKCAMKIVDSSSTSLKSKYIVHKPPSAESSIPSQSMHIHSGCQTSTLFLESIEMLTELLQHLQGEL